jgi:hypothetical protein
VNQILRILCKDKVLGPTKCYMYKKSPGSDRLYSVKSGIFGGAFYMYGVLKDAGQKVLSIMGSFVNCAPHQTLLR